MELVTLSCSSHLGSTAAQARRTDSRLRFLDRVGLRRIRFTSGERRQLFVVPSQRRELLLRQPFSFNESIAGTVNRRDNLVQFQMSR